MPFSIQLHWNARGLRIAICRQTCMIHHACDGLGCRVLTACWGPFWSGFAPLLQLDVSTSANFALSHLIHPIRFPHPLVRSLLFSLFPLPDAAPRNQSTPPTPTEYASALSYLRPSPRRIALLSVRGQWAAVFARAGTITVRGCVPRSAGSFLSCGQPSPNVRRPV